jgi:hypothetical protein
MDLVGVVAAAKRQTVLKRAQSDLYFLCTEILKYDKLTETFHRPMMVELDDRNRRRRKGKYVKDELELWPRDHFKTTVRIGQVIQQILYDPNTAIAMAHAVDEKSQEFVEEVGNHLMKNDDLRRLRPEIMPSKLAKKWLTSDQFTVRRQNGVYRRHPTLQGKGASSEVTGGHADIYLLDDIVGQSTVDDNGMPKLRSWYRSTVRNVLRTDGGWIWATGTRWDTNDIWSDFIASPDWDVRVRAALETDGKPDYAGSPVLYDLKWIERKRRELGPAFGPQMMNDPSPAGEKPWTLECESFISKKEADQSRGFVVVITDPAPAKIGSTRLAMGSEFKGFEGKKDEWATAVLKLRRVGDRREIILLDGDSSKEWETDEGFERMATLAYRYRARGACIEQTGQNISTYGKEWQAAKRKVGVSGKEIDLETTYRGKNFRFGILASRAKSGEFLISEGCSKSFVEKFLEQARGWRPNGARNSLHEDGAADVVSYSCDSGLEAYYEKVVGEMRFLGPLDEEAVEPHYSRRSRYCAV